MEAFPGVASDLARLEEAFDRALLEVELAQALPGVAFDHTSETVLKIILSHTISTD